MGEQRKQGRSGPLPPARWFPAHGSSTSGLSTTVTPRLTQQTHTLSSSTWLRRRGPFRPGHSLPLPPRLHGERHRGDFLRYLHEEAGVRQSSRHRSNASLHSVNHPHLSEEKLVHPPHPACDMRRDKICLGGMTWPAARLSDHSNRTLSL